MRRNSKKRKSKLFILIFAILLGIIYYRNIINRPLKITNEIVQVKVEEGESLIGLLDKLDDNGLLRSKFILKLNVKFFNSKASLIPGTYAINKDTSFNNILNILEHEGTASSQLVISIPEGNTIDDIAVKLSNAGLFSKEDFLEAVRSAMYATLNAKSFSGSNIFTIESNLHLLIRKKLLDKGIKCVNVYDGFYVVKSQISKAEFNKIYNESLVELKNNMKNHIGTTLTSAI